MDPWRSIARMEILVVEDEAGIADSLARGLEAEGYSVTIAADGIIGERLALSPNTDLVVLDRMLPGRDGIEVLATIRRSKPALPVILLTAKAEVADRVEGLDLGATDYVTKPLPSTSSWLASGPVSASPTTRRKRLWTQVGYAWICSPGKRLGATMWFGCPTGSRSCSPT
jgi:CheY-like chemotaxis protein